MTLEELRTEMQKTNKDCADDPEACHCELDDLLLKYINDDEIRKLFDEVEKWYA